MVQNMYVCALNECICAYANDVCILKINAYAEVDREL